METRKERLDKIQAEREAKMLQEQEKHLQIERENILQNSISDCLGSIASFMMTEFYGKAKISFHNFDRIAQEAFLVLATKSQCKPHFTFCENFVSVDFGEKNKVDFFIPKENVQELREIANEMWLTSEEVQYFLENLNNY